MEGFSDSLRRRYDVMMFQHLETHKDGMSRTGAMLIVDQAGVFLQQPSQSIDGLACCFVPA